MEIELTDEQLKQLAELVAQRIVGVNALASKVAPSAKTSQMDISQVAQSFGVSAASIRRWMREDLSFPAPISAGLKFIWERVDIERHKNNLKRLHEQKFHPRGRLRRAKKRH